MKYYSIQKSYHPSFVGKGNSFHSNKVKYPLHVDDPILIDKFHLEKIDIIPNVYNVILNDKATPNDLISNLMGRLLISSKLKGILDGHNVNGVQFFHAPIIHKEKEVEGYWIMHPYKLHMDLIDYTKSEIYIAKDSGIKIDPDPIEINSYQEFTSLTTTLRKEGYKGIKNFVGLSIEKVHIKEGIDLPLLNTIRCSGSMHFISEKLKNDIEKAKCTAIEFKPSDISFIEWNKPNGDREKKYGYR